jgi:tyrosinase
LSINDKLPLATVDIPLIFALKFNCGISIMKVHISLLVFSACYALGQSTPDTNNLKGPCKNPRVRRSWFVSSWVLKNDLTPARHGLSNEEKLEYIRAVQCLYNSPAKGKAYFPAATSRHDDFAALHINHTTAPALVPTLASKSILYPSTRYQPSTDGGIVGPGIHFNGVFLPWHRYAPPRPALRSNPSSYTTWTYETALIEECNYRGAQPFWDWTLDNPEYGATFSASPVFDPAYGFGGNGALGTLPELPRNATQPNGSPGNVSGSCFATGPFAGIRPTLGPGYSFSQVNPHCVHRNLDQPLAQAALGWTANVVPLLRNTLYANFTHQFDFPNTDAATGIHGGGHGGVSGEVRFLLPSPSLSLIAW